MLAYSNPESAQVLLQRAQDGVSARWRQYEHLAAMLITGNGPAQMANSPAHSQVKTGEPMGTSRGHSQSPVASTSHD